jgi:hypothetical protein
MNDTIIATAMLAPKIPPLLMGGIFDVVESYGGNQIKQASLLINRVFSFVLS